MSASVTPAQCTDNPISLTSFVARQNGVIVNPTFITLGTLPPQALNVNPTLASEIGIYEIEVIAEVDDGTGVIL